jgi:3-phenylpropionate/trans-cinnamate dioxygenase ferredoxin subunit
MEPVPATFELTKIPKDGMIGVTVDGFDILLANVGGEISALDAVCTHEGCIVSDGKVVEGAMAECPCHKSKFDLLTGQVCNGPAREPLRRFGVTVADGKVTVTIPRVRGFHKEVGPF